MKSSELIGKVAALYLRRKVDSETGSSDQLGGTARFTIDCLTPEEIASICNAILGEPDLSQKFEIRLPRRYLD